MQRNILIQFLTLKKLCWFVRSNINRKPMASRKKAVVRLRNLEARTVLAMLAQHKSYLLLNRIFSLLFYN